MPDPIFPWGDGAIMIGSAMIELGNGFSVPLPGRFFLGVVRAFALAVERAEPHTAGHQRGTSRFAVRLARRLRFPAASVRLIAAGGLLHDVGKIGIPRSILLRPGRLSAAEYDVVKEHPRLGFEIMRKMEFANPLATVILQHHERQDGSGYPHGLRNGAIMDESLAVAVADASHAMASRRSYHQERGETWMLEALERDRGIRFPAAYVDAAIDLLRTDIRTGRVSMH
jgi:putative nucleotidyltransferase with HDIG domain